MPTLLNYDRTVTGRCRVTGPTGQVTSYTPTALRNRELKIGTGPRRKPKAPDETSYDREVVIWRVPNGSGSTTPNSGGKGFEMSGTFPFTATTFSQSFLWPTLTLDSNLVDDAGVKAMAKLNHRDLDLGTAWKERSKTADLIRGVATTAAEALRDIKRRDGRGLLNTLGLDHDGARGRGVVDAYLAYQYGMKPLLNDVKGATQALARLPPDRWRVEVTGASARDYFGSGIANATSYPVFFSRESRQSCRAKISAVQNPINREQDLQWALGLDNPLGTAWEITPFSFVADWMIPIGDWLEALNAFKYYSGYRCTYSQFLKEEVKWRGASVNQFGSQWSTSGNGYGSSLKIRRTVTSIPYLGLPIRDPRSVRNMANALSLLASRSANSAELPRFLRY